MSERSPQPSSPAAEPIAIIGMSCRYPGAGNLDAFWQLLRDGVDGVTEIPPDRWDIDTYYDADPAAPGKMLTRWGGFLDRIDQFDARFFNISPREANHMDPQQRQLLEVAWEALEHAGQTPERISGSHGGVFVSTLGHDYDEYMFDDYSNIDAYIGTGNAHCVAANRLSYVFDLHGPSVALDTACSGSLVAIHMACQSLRSGESQLAIAGGVNVILLPKFNIFFSKAGATAPDGRCKTFDARANGIVRSEGVGIVVLKRLSQALADGDPIQAVIRGSAVNSDGRSNGLMAPNPQAQETLLREAYRVAGVAPSEMQYIEAHGTGTPLGDPIEVQSLGAVLSAGRADDEYCAIGSIKTNIGHTEAAAGVAGIIKVALAMQHRQIPPSLHFQTPNPRIPFAELPIRVQQALGPWPTPSKPLLAGVSAFGIGGTNAHVVLEEAPARASTPTTEATGAHLLTLSAKTPGALQDLARSYQQLVTADAPPALADLCYSAGVRRAHHDYRLSAVAESHAELAEQLTAFVNGENRARLTTGRKTWDTSKKLAWVFSGQGSHWIGMGCELAAREPAFKAELDAVDQVLSQHVDWSLLDVLSADGETSRLNETAVTQPSIFAIQVALAALWRSWGIRPDAVVGHSLGEIAAAYVAGALRLEDAVRIVVERSRLMQRVAGQGLTAVVELPFEQAQFMLAGNEDRLAIAGSNSPTSSVLSGEPAALERVLQFVERRNIFCRVLQGVDIAFHSPQMDPLKDDLVSALATIQSQPTTLPIYSTVTAQLHDGAQFDAAYWGRNLREPFMFAAVVQTMLQAGYTTFIEVSPHPVLVKPIQDGAKHAQATATALASLRRNEVSYTTLFTTLGTLYTQGRAVEWANVYSGAQRYVTLPTYPWQHERFWYTKTAIGGPRSTMMDAPLSAPTASGGKHPLLGPIFKSALPDGSYYWQKELRSDAPAYLADHCVQGVVLVPGAVYVEMALAAAEQVFGAGQSSVEELALKQAFFLSENGARTVQFVLTREADDAATFQILSAPVQSEPTELTWTLHASGKLHHTTAAAAAPQAVDPAEIQARCGEHIAGAVHYHRMSAYLGLQYGPMFQAVEQIWRRDGEVLCELRLPEMLESEFGAYRIHPAIFDAALQVVTATLPMHEGTATGDHTFLPVALQRVQIHGALKTRLWCHVVLRSEVSLKADSHTADIYLLDESGAVVVEAPGLQLHPLGGVQDAGAARDIGECLYEVAWQPAPPAETAVPTAPANWLIFTDRGGLGQRLQTQLAARGDRCRTVAYHSGDAAAPTADELVDLAGAEPFKRLLESAAYPTTGLIYLWGLDATPTAATTAATLELDHARICGSLLGLVQTVALGSLAQSPRLWIVTRGAQAVAENVAGLNPAQASLWGLGRVVAHEHPDLRSVLIDLDADPAAQRGESALLLDELTSAGSEPEIALVDGQRYRARLERQSSASTAAVPFTWRTDGAYMITGGLGGLGLAVARWMVEQGARRLILTGRTPLPPRADWQRISNPQQAATIDAIRAIEALGASVHVASLDVTSEQALAAFLEGYRAESWPPIRGVVHAAGVLNDQLLLRMDQAALMQVLRPKVVGSWNLHRLLHDEPLDFFVMFSSIAALLGSIGQGNYAAGNAFMDALAHYRRAQGAPAQSINWGPWSEIGMAAHPELTERLDAGGIDVMTPTRNLEALAQVLRQPVAQTMILSVDWQRWPAGDTSGLVAALVAGNARADGENIVQQALFVNEVLLPAAEADRPALLEQHLQGLVAQVLGLEPSRIDPQQPLNTLGLDSIMALELKNSIEATLGLAVPLVAILQGPSTAEFAERILPQLLETSAEMEAMLAELEDLSLEEVQALLAAESVAVEGVME